MATTTPAEANKALVRRVIDEVVDQRDYDVLEETHANDFVLHTPLAPDAVTSRDAYEESLRGTLEVFGDIEVTIEDIVADDDYVAYRATFSATHEGEIMGVPATGKKVSWEVISLGRIEDGKFVELRGQHDVLDLMRQIGVTEVPGE